MNYAPQGWLADFSAMTDEIVRSNESMDIDEMDSFQDQSEVDGLVAEIMHRKRKYKPRQVVCQDCGEIFTGAGTVLKYCPKCKAERKQIWQDEYQQRQKKRAKAREVNAQEEQPNTAPVETVLVNRSVEAHDVKADDVPDVPADDYYSEANKIKKTAPIETVLVPKKEDKEMDTERAERLKTFPSMSKRLEHPEYFTGDALEDLDQTMTVPADIPTTCAPDRKRRLMDLYGTLNAYCESFGVAASDVLDRLRKIDEALS